MKKKICQIFVTIFTLVLMSGCNLKEKISESISEQIAPEETISEESTETAVDLSAIASGAEYEWPTDQAASYLPMLANGTITYALNGPDTCLLLVEDISLDDYKNYKKAIIEAGFTEDILDSSAENLELYSGASAEECLATISYDNKAGTLQITIETTADE